MTQQPEALRLADYLTDRNRLDLTCDEAAAELRRLHEVNAELLEALLFSYGFIHDNKARDKASAAIAKATGEQP